MSRKAKKGYFVRGQFVPLGSELDAQYRLELKGGTDAPSRTELKRQSTALQTLGNDLLQLHADALARLALPEALLNALEQARRITDFEGRRRQMQYVGKLMRKLAEDEVQAIHDALQEQRTGSAAATLLLHEAENWRERLLQDDAAVAQWLTQFPGSDAQQLRALIRQARKDARPAPDAGAPVRQGRASRELFRLLRGQLEGEATS